MTESVPRFPLRLAACAAGRPLAQRVAICMGQSLVPVDETWFSCGEGKITYEENVRGSDLYVFQSAVAPDDDRTLYDRTMMLLHAVEAAAMADAASITAVVPYYPCARQDKRKQRTREGVSAGLMARCLQAAGASRVISVEVHNEAIVGMFHPRECRFENLTLHRRFSNWLHEQGLNGDIVAAPDVGGLERARNYAADLSEGLAVINKVRDYRTPNRIVQSTLIGDVEDQDVLLVDDIVDTAGSVVAAVDQLRQGGAHNVTVACAHPVFSGPAMDRLSTLAATAEHEGWRFRVAGTTSIEHTNMPEWYVSFDLAPMIAGVIQAINERKSVTEAHC